MLLSLAIALTSIPGVKNIVWAADEDVDYVAEVEYGSCTIVTKQFETLSQAFAFAGTTEDAKVNILKNVTEELKQVEEELKNGFYLDLNGKTVTITGVFDNDKNEINVISTGNGVLNINAKLSTTLMLLDSQASDAEINSIGFDISDQSEGNVQMVLNGGYYSADSENQISNKCVTLGDGCIIEYYEKLSDDKKAEWAEIADPDIYIFKIVDTSVGAIVSVNYTIESENGDSIKEKKYYTSIADMAADLDKIDESLDKGQSIPDGFNIVLLDDITISKEESYSVKNDKTIYIDLNGHTLTVDGKLDFGCNCYYISSEDYQK